MPAALKILILEDRSEDVELVLYELRRAGFHPRWWHAENEEQYKQYLVANEVDVILADYMLPQFDALKALQMLKETKLDVPFIVVTGTVSEEVVVECMQQGAADYLLKDRLTRLGQAITHALDERRLRIEKRHAETALFESDARFMRLAENAQDIIYRFRFSPEWAVEYISPAVMSIIGYAPQEFYKDKTLWQRVLHPDDVASFQDRNNNNQLNVPNYPLRIYRRDGEVRWLEIRDAPIFDEQGKLIAIEGVARDSTERILADEALRESEAKFKAIFHESLDVIFIADSETGNIIHINDAVRRVLGYEPEALAGTHFSTLFGTQEVFTGKQLDVFGTSLETNFFMRADGTACPMDVTATIIPWGKNQAILATMRDVTEREQAAVALRHNEAKLRALLGGLPDYMFLVRGDGIILESKFPRNASFDTERFVGQDIAAFSDLAPIPPSSIRAIKLAIQNAIATRETQAIELRFDVSDRGDERYFDVRATASSANEVVLMVRDVTASRHAHEQLLRAELLRDEVKRERELLRLKENFISMVSHEFRTPLAVILSATETLELYADQLPLERQVEKFQKIKLQTEYMNEMLNDVLFVSRAQAGKLRFNPQPINLAEFCLDIIEHVKLRSGHKLNIITFRYEDPIVTASLDERLLRHILINLLENATKYSPAGSEVIFDVAGQADRIVFKIIDQGIGIPLNDQSRLFEPFHRARNAEDISGTGLGLSIVKNSVDVHQGTISYESQANAGSTFIVTLPRDAK